MRTFRLNAMAAAALACFVVAPSAMADDELLIYALKGGSLARDLQIAVDGQAPQRGAADGLFHFDLGAGSHSVQIFEGEQLVHAFRVDAAADQRIDVRVDLSAGEPQVSVDRYFASESGVDRATAANGGVSGRVSYGGQPLAGASISVPEVGASTTTDAEGHYDLSLPRGSYDLRISHDSLEAPADRPVRVVANLTLPLNVAIPSASSAEPEPDGEIASLEEIVVTAAPTTTQVATERFSENVVDSIDAAQLARFGDSDVGASVTRLPSITIEDGRYVFVRGLGGRYITTTLNGATLPSPDPNRRTVPLDLFPSNIVDALDVSKTFLAGMPSESTGGNVAISTRSFPESEGGKVSIKLGYTAGLTGDKAYADPTSGAFDFVGWDDGSRRVPGLVPLISDALEFSDEYSDNTQAELRQVGGLLLMNDLDYDRETATPKASLGVNYGNVFDLDDGRQLGFFVAGNYKNQWEQREKGISRTYNASLATRNDFEFEEHTNSVEASGLLAVGYNVGLHSFKSNTIVSRFTDSRVKVTDGRDGDALLDSHRYTIEWAERQFVSQQLSGSHIVNPSGSLTGDWQATISQAKRLAPDRRDVRFDLKEGDGIYNLEVPDLARRFDDLVDDNNDISGNLTWIHDTSLGTSTIKVGAQAINRERDAQSNTYGWLNSSAIDDNAANLLVSDVINATTITGDASTGYAFSDETLASDSYNADMQLRAGYLSWGQLYGGLEVIAGVRFESYTQRTHTFALNAAIPDPVDSTISSDDWLPSLALNWYVSDSQQVRAAVTKTLIRPDFKETANAVFYDPEFDFRIRGNPNLTPGEAINYDLRYEHYFSSSESASIAAFYKDLTDPIERVVQLGSGSADNTRTFENARSGELYGFEVDGRKDFNLNDAYSRSLFVALNASYIESEVELTDGSTPKLQGQPDYTFNLVLGYDDIETGQEITLLLNQSGDTIVDRGTNQTPDIVQEPRLSLNLTYKLELSDSLLFRAKASNLLDDAYELTQGGNVYQRYKRGVELEAGIDWTF